MNTKFRIYTDGTVEHQDAFDELDSQTPYYDDFEGVEVPDLVIEHIENVVLGK